MPNGAAEAAATWLAAVERLRRQQQLTRDPFMAQAADRVRRRVDARLAAADRARCELQGRHLGVEDLRRLALAWLQQHAAHAGR